MRDRGHLLTVIQFYKQLTLNEVIIHCGQLLRIKHHRIKIVTFFMCLLLVPRWTFSVNFHFDDFLLSILCMTGIEESLSLSVCAKLTAYFSEFLILLGLLFRGNKSVNLSLAAHLVANLSANICLLSLRFQLNSGTKVMSKKLPQES